MPITNEPLCYNNVPKNPPMGCYFNTTGPCISGEHYTRDEAFNGKVIHVVGL